MPPMPARTIPAVEADVSLAAAAGQVRATRETVLVEVPGTPGVAMVPAEVLAGLEETVAVLGDPTVVQRLRQGEYALQTGNFLGQQELEQRLGVPASPVNPGVSAWRLVAAAGACQAIEALANEHVRRAVTAFVFTTLRDAPAAAGVELRGELNRRYAARVGGQRVVYRLDTTQRVVRLIDVHRCDDGHGGW